MRSIPLMLTWELLNQKRWTLIGTAFAGLIFPTLIFAALRYDGPIPPEDPNMIISHVIMIQINTFIFGMGIIVSQGKPSRLFTFPINVSSIVAWHLLLSMVAMAIETVAFTLFLNAVFDLGWPIWGPALFAAVSLAALQSVMWLTEKSPWIVFALTLVMGPFGIWFKMLHGPAFSTPTHYWREVTVVQVLTMLTIAGLAYVTAVMGVKRNRRGDPLGSLGILAWFERLFDQVPESVNRFPTPAQAQRWLEWKRKGWIAPSAVGFSLLLGLCFWTVFFRDVDSLVFGLVVIGGMMASVMMFIGPMMGSDTSHGDPNFDISPFMATRPMTTAQMARITLRVGMESTFAGWAIWAVASLATYLVLFALGMSPQNDPFSDVAWWYFPATLLGPCAVMALGICVGLAGRSALFAKLLGAAMVIYIGGSFVSRFFLPSELALQLLRAAAISASLILIGGTIGTFAVAYRRLQIGWPTVYVAASLWVGLVAMIVIDQLFRQPGSVPLQVMLIGLATLAVAPLAAAPLALAWNRTR